MPDDCQWYGVYVKGEDGDIGLCTQTTGILPAIEDGLNAYQHNRGERRWPGVGELVTIQVEDMSPMELLPWCNTWNHSPHPAT